MTSGPHTPADGLLPPETALAGGPCIPRRGGSTWACRRAELKGVGEDIGLVRSLAGLKGRTGA